MEICHIIWIKNSNNSCKTGRDGEGGEEEGEGGNWAEHYVFIEVNGTTLVGKVTPILVYGTLWKFVSSCRAYMQVLMDIGIQ